MLSQINGYKKKRKISPKLEKKLASLPNDLVDHILDYTGRSHYIKLLPLERDLVDLYVEETINKFPNLLPASSRTMPFKRAAEKQKKTDTINGYKEAVAQSPAKMNELIDNARSPYRYGMNNKAYADKMGNYPRSEITKALHRYQSRLTAAEREEARRRAYLANTTLISI